jgi:Ca2+-binding RTX toxin-like protein
MVQEGREGHDIKELKPFFQRKEQLPMKKILFNQEQGSTMRRRAVLVLSTAATALILSSGVALAANAFGTPGDDNIVGTPSSDGLLGNAGNDTIRALGGFDVVSGGADNDELVAGPASDFSRNVVRGDSGDDTIFGSSGPDELDGGADNDTIQDARNSAGDEAVDTVFGGEGDDTIDVASVHASRDEVNCGPGVDKVRTDERDAVAADCEIVNPIEEEPPAEDHPQEGTGPAAQPAV